MIYKYTLVPVLLIAVLLTATHAQDLPSPPTIKKFQPLKCFLLHTSVTSTTNEASWIFFGQDGRGEAGPESPEEVIKLYESKDAKMKENGILIWCFLHSVPEKDRTDKVYSEFMRACAKDPAYMASLNAMVDKLVVYCNTLKIPVWINITSDPSGDFKLLTQTAKP